MTDLSVGARPVHISASVALGQLPVPPVVAPHGSNDQAELGSAGNRVESVPEVAPDGNPRP
ncbi:MAG TPA: hypothetical protein VII26_01480 [Candidatus Limnocylindria bacterium]